MLENICKVHKIFLNVATPAGIMDRHFYEEEIIRKVAGESFFMPTHRFFQGRLFPTKVDTSNHFQSQISFSNNLWKIQTQ